MADRTHSTSRRTLLAAPLTLAAAPASAAPRLSTPDARLLELLAETREAEVEYARAVYAADEPAQDQAMERLEAVLDAMAGTASEGWQGIAAKVVRLCFSLREGGGGEWGSTIMYADIPVAKSLTADLARLAPEVQA